MATSLKTRLDKLEDDIKMMLFFQKKSNKEEPQIPALQTKRTPLTSPRTQRTPIATPRTPRSLSVTSNRSKKITPARSKSGPGGDKSRSVSPKPTQTKTKIPIQKRQTSRKRIITKIQKPPITSTMPEIDGCDALQVGQIKKQAEQQLQDILLRKDVEIEITKLRKLVDDLNKARLRAVEYSFQWKDKYNTLNKTHTKQTQLYEATKNERGVLAETLDIERNRLDKALADLEKCEKQIAKVQSISKKCEELCGIVTEKDSEIKELKQSNESLGRKCVELSTKLRVLNENFEQLKTTNQNLAADIVNKYKNLEEVTLNADKECAHYKEQTKNALKVVEQFKESCAVAQKKVTAEHKINEKLKAEAASMKKSLRIFKNREGSIGKDMGKLEAKIKAMQEEQMYVKKISTEAMELLTQENSYLKERFAEMQDKLKENQTAGAEQCKVLQAELEVYKKAVEQKEHILLGEKDELKELIENMTEIVKRQKERIGNLCGATKEQEAIIHDQATTINQKNEELERMNVEVGKLREQCNDLEKELKRTAFTDEKEQLEELKQKLEEEMDNMKIKDTILDDHANTITQLKKKILEKESTVAQLCRELNSEKRTKNDLNGKIYQLEGENTIISQEFLKTQKDMDKQSYIIDNLEKQLELQTKEWDLKKELLLKQKAKATRAAKFATNKLAETMHEFQRQTESQNKVRNLLTALLQEKDNKLKSAILQMTSLTFDPDAVLDSVIKEARFKESQSFLGTSNSESSNYVDATTAALEELYFTKSRNRRQDHGCYNRMYERANENVITSVLSKNQPSGDSSTLNFEFTDSSNTNESLQSYHRNVKPSRCKSNPTLSTQRHSMWSYHK